MALRVEVVSPERVLFSDDAEMVIARAEGGDIAFLSGHVPFVGTLGIAPVRVRTEGGEEETFAVHGGFVEVNNDRAIILSDVAEPAADIDVERAQEAQRRAEEALRTASDEEAEAEAQAALRRAEVRLEVGRSRS